MKPSTQRPLLLPEMVWPRCSRWKLRAGIPASPKAVLRNGFARKETHRYRSTLSKIWIPTGGFSAVEGETGHGKLLRAGFLRQAQSGIFQLLPLGLRVQHKIEALIDQHMKTIGASRISLSAISSAELWQKSGRLERVSSELFRFSDRKETPLLLSPTHEEEITSLVASSLKSYKDLPLRLYQTSRKYRDEMRPRHGLLRSREFVMKDLYTFDTSAATAIETYKEVSSAYKAFFSDLRLPVITAEASSGEMGGEYSHEYHLAHPIGEDTIATCSSCGFAASDDVAIDRSPNETEQALAPHSEQVTVCHDYAIDDKCPQCKQGPLQLVRALELGHTFFLGDRYSKAFGLSVSLPGTSNGPEPVQMGCYGIGVSRIMGAVAEHKSDQRGLGWPRAIAPFEVVVIPTSGVTAETLDLFDMLAAAGSSQTPRLDIVLDDRALTFGWKMQDADLIGYPVTVVLGKAWREEGICEVQCRSLGLKENVPVERMPLYLEKLLAQL